MYSLEAESIVKDANISSGSFEDFLNNIEVNIIRRTGLVIEIDIKNCHPSIANAIRRILISETPSVAIHDVVIRENDTIFPDEYVAHRLGLVPIRVDPDVLDNNDKLKFELKKKNETSEVIEVYSRDIHWIPLENQDEIDLHMEPDILICKLAPGNTIDMELYAEKGVGMTHAKWSPVSLCSYRLMSKIVLLRDFEGEEALKLQKCFSEGVIKIVDGRAVVDDPRKDTMSREVLRHPEFKDSVKLFRESGWFCFTIESLALDPLMLFKKAIEVLINKCDRLKLNIASLRK